MGVFHFGLYKYMYVKWGMKAALWAGSVDLDYN